MNLAELEGEALLLGHWKNIADLEECLNLQELNLILKAQHDKEYRQHKFAAALKGIDLDDNETKAAKERFEDVQRRAQARLTGQDPERQEMYELGFEFEVEE